MYYIQPKTTGFLFGQANLYAGLPFAILAPIVVLYLYDAKKPKDKYIAAAFAALLGYLVGNLFLGIFTKLAPQHQSIT